MCIRDSYSALQKLNTADINICSVEDPVEIPIAGLNQTQIHPRAGLTFQGVLRALLRQDPDVIMIGEIDVYKRQEPHCGPLR